MTTSLPPRAHYSRGSKGGSSERNKRSNAGISADEFYQEYHGHTIPHLEAVHKGLKKDGRVCCYLVGDSTMDNKYWLSGRRAGCVNGYEEVLRGRMVKDISYWLNKTFSESTEGSKFFCLNAAVEESTLGVRQNGILLEHDKFVQDSIGQDDVLICSVGGNDIALRPSAGTIFNMIMLLCQPQSMIASGWAVGIGHFKDLWKRQTEDYLKSLCLKKMPKVIVVCTLYFLDEKPGNSWADGVLSKLGYDTNPGKIQMLIEKIYEDATCKVEIDGTTVIPFPLFKVLDGKNTKDYAQRVEPSILGGKKIGKALASKVMEVYNKD
mgnify:CR=1 FL=1